MEQTNKRIKLDRLKRYPRERKIIGREKKIIKIKRRDAR